MLKTIVSHFDAFYWSEMIVYRKSRPYHEGRSCPLTVEYFSRLDLKDFLFHFPEQKLRCKGDVLRTLILIK